jgi:RecA-family ATPase
VELLAIASGGPLLGVAPDERCPVWYWNGEDPMDELLRRVMAAAVHFGLSPATSRIRFFVNTGRSTPIIVAERTRDGVTINAPVVDQVIATIKANKIGVMSVDPFVACHRVTENDNSEIERVAKTWARIADETGCSIELVHHVRKSNGNEVTVEDGRGAVALLSAARAARVINRMTQDEAARVAISDPQFYFRLDNGKANLAPPSAVQWFHLASVDLGNDTPMTATSQPVRATRLASWSRGSGRTSWAT